ncbi:hypothetical protein NHX12_031933 [Muraenolepis orangiensis]|uniref:Uncharacterized protein n=1 Tax=Muraenolepis orangiensis TaxID=630683 RepID=A0A9Q0E5D8_9TELE|nr:hypothetical protein NHX12_031933 [Muraenolepis orangiensis]
MTSTWGPEALKEAYGRAEVAMLQSTRQEKGIMKKRMAKYYKLWQDQGIVSKQHPPTREQLRAIRVLARNLMRAARKGADQDSQTRSGKVQKAEPLRPSISRLQPGRAGGPTGGKDDSAPRPAADYIITHDSP